VVACPARAVGHDRRIAPVELHAHGLVEIVGLSEVEACRGAAQQALGREQVGAGKAQPLAFELDLAADGAEREIAIPRDGREQQVGFQLQGPDPQHATS